MQALMKIKLLLLSLSLLTLGACASDPEIACDRMEECAPEEYSQYSDDAACQEDFQEGVGDESACASCLDDNACAEILSGECSAECAR